MKSRHTLRRWLVIAVLAGAAVAIARAWPKGARPVATGIVALVLLVVVAAYAARKWSLSTRLGDLHTWALGHVVLGAVLLVAVAAHAGFVGLALGGCILYGLLFLDVASGIWGTLELAFGPRRFARLSHDGVTFPSTARRRLAVLRLGVDRAVARRSREFGRWFGARYQEVLGGRGGVVPPCEGFPPLERRAAEELHERVVEIARLRPRQGELERLERASRRWLDLHVPVSVALAIIVLLHVVGWLIYG